MKFQCCRLKSRLSLLRGTLASLLIVSCQHVCTCCSRLLWRLLSAIRQLRPLKRQATDEAIKTLTHVFTSSRLDYCNVLYCGIAEGLLNRLQSVQNAVARLVTGVGRREHNTCPAAASLAAGSSACDVQAGDVGPPLTSRN